MSRPNYHERDIYTKHAPARLMPRSQRGYIAGRVPDKFTPLDNYAIPNGELAKTNDAERLIKELINENVSAEQAIALLNRAHDFLKKLFMIDRQGSVKLISDLPQKADDLIKFIKKKLARIRALQSRFAKYILQPSVALRFSKSGNSIS